MAEKRDGTLFYPAERSDGEILWCTRAGETDLAKALAADLPPHLLSAIERTLLRSEDGASATPLFEHTSAWNRIVVAYASTEITWLASRDRASGRYWSRAEMERAAARAKERCGADVRIAPVVAPSVDGAGAARELARTVREKEVDDEEGVVIAFAGGHRLKMKVGAYVVRHRVRSELDHEHHTLRAVVDGHSDDLEALLPDEAAERLRRYREQVDADLAAVAERIDARVREGRALDRKTFAQEVTGAKLPAIERAATFVARTRAERGQPPATVETLRDLIARNTASGPRVVSTVHPVLPTARWRWGATPMRNTNAEADPLEATKRSITHTAALIR